MSRPILFSLLFLGTVSAPGQPAPSTPTATFRSGDYSATLTNDTLTLENARIRRRYRWNEGNLVSLRLEDPATGKGWNFTDPKPDFSGPNFAGKAAEQPPLGQHPLGGVSTATADRAGEFRVREIPASSIAPAHLAAEVQFRMGNLAVKRVFRIYKNGPAIACDVYLRGELVGTNNAGTNPGDLTNIEDQKAASEGKANAPVMERLRLPGNHWRVRSVNFYDITDRHNTLVEETNSLVYRNQKRLMGNLLFLNSPLEEQGLFVLKEAPPADVQLAYPGFDFVTQIGEVQVTGLGLAATDIRPDAWTKGYGFVTGLTSAGELGRLTALRQYQENLRIRRPDRDEMLLMNTWGDRNRGNKLSEAFCLAELEAGHRLGISHFQLDAGWYASRNPAEPGFWQPHPTKFPKGLGPLVAKAAEYGIRLGLWFTANKEKEYAGWRTDAGAVLRLYREYGIKTFKIDLIDLRTKQAEINFKNLLDTLQRASNYELVVNLDITAEHRYGYHYFNQYGNFFLENRYTDWTNYYPHWTLRNLWMLARYVPPQTLQIEFLNKWRNQDKYPPGDPFAPATIPFDYQFAVTLMAHPLAWFEATGLPQEAFALAPMVKTYRQRQADLHGGRIFPIGEEPSGAGWTGFQSMREGWGYVIVYREKNEQPEKALTTWFTAGQRVDFRAVLGQGTDFSATIGEEGRVTVRLPQPNSFALYEYQIK